MALSSSTSTHSFVQLSAPCLKTPKKSRNPTQIYCRKGSSSGANDKQNKSHLMVDENLIVLRKRIHEMKIIERNYEAPTEWMDWEKRYYASYDTYICEAMGVLQSHLMSTRPSLAIGMMALVALSVPTSTLVVMSHFFDIINAGVAGISSHM
ncbi:Mediator of RNA polymerase II transcription subunit [Heracleum sosnowskyi]|uniref:Mediator of RNA polymerase II transcription subunit n=1 Tax=Heracleum sosnowskyi TaxID=360622 RepID=A0AAD8MVL3_9APIA|nr:Mediator of RNA polymerase II transcription subunit [Heracleum sosnowskyi]